MRQYLVGTILAVLIACGFAQADLQVATFVADVTPPVGHPCCGGWIKPVIAVDDPLLAKGVVLRDEGGTYVLCAVDWCLLRGKAYDLFREKIAAAVGTDVSRVAVQTVHQHNAPNTDSEAQVLLNQTKEPPTHADLAFLEAAATKVAEAARQATQWQTVTQVGTSKAKVEQIASNRRVPKAGGGIAVRYSSSKDPAMQAAPEGLIDPYLRTITFFNGDKPIVQMHYYAVHPQSFYGDGRVTWDVPGIARERLEKETGVFQVYFTGCAGNVTAGKYNNGTPEARKALAERLYTAMKQSIAEIKREAVAPIQWRVRPVRLPARQEPEYTEKELRPLIGVTTTQPVTRIKAAVDLAAVKRIASDRPVEFSCLGMGDIRILHLPGEPFIEHQLFAQEAGRGEFVAVAGYGDDFTGYICTEKAYAEGGYEPTETSLAPSNEGYMHAAITDLLAEKAPVAPTIKEVRKIWDAAPHNAFTDLVRWHDRWYCTFREAPKHVSEEGNIRIIASSDGEKWESVLLLSEAGKDLRDPKLSITPDDRLMLLGGLRTWPPKYEATLQSWVAFSKDGATWTPRQTVLEQGLWLWRVTWNANAAYGIAYGGKDPKHKETDWFSRLVHSDDGIHYDRLAEFASLPGMTEAMVQFDANGRMYCVHRRDAGTQTALLGTSDPPYAQWNWHDTGFHLGGPALLNYKGQWWTAGRWVVGGARTVLARADFDKGTIEPVLYFPSGGDTSYPGLVANGDELWMSYYSSHEGKGSIYLAKIAFP